MKGYTAASAPPVKRRWKGFAVAVLALVFCSLLVPLAFLLGLHNRFPSGYLIDERSPSESTFGNDVYKDSDRESDLPQGDRSGKVDVLLEQFGIEPAFSKDGTEKITSESIGNSSHSTSQPKYTASHTKGLPTPQVSPSKPLQTQTPNTSKDGRNKHNNHANGSTGDGTERSCQLEFGSYCLWSIEHKEVMKDSMVKRLKDQLFVARAYYPSIAKLQAQEKLSREMKQNIQEHERMLSEAILDVDLPPFVEKKIQKMDQTIARAKSCSVDCNNVDKKLRQILDLTEDEAHFHMKQSAFLYHLGVQTMPKSHHCLSMRLTVDYFKSPLVDREFLHADKLDSPTFRHYVIFSRNILASSVAVNSTVMNSQVTGNIVFHLLTDGQNYYAFKLWFTRNHYKEATVHVLNIEDLKLNHSHNLGFPQLPMSEEFRVSLRNIDQQSLAQMKTEYISVFGHSHFLLPEIFKHLKKVVVLDDDVVVQRDLSPLWNLDLEGKVNGAVEFCGVRLGQLKTYFGSRSYDGNSCVWMSGLNIVDLEKWREHNITGIYHQLLQAFQSRSEASWRAAALPTSLLAFQDLVYALDNSWSLSGLGHDYGVSADIIKNASVLHYNGNMKPWLELGIPKYKRYWKNFLTQEERFMDECNVNS